MKYLFLSFAVLFNASAYIIFKTISGKPNNLQWFMFFSIGLILGAINTCLFTKSLKEINLGIAYPVFSAASITLILLISVFLFNEKINITNIIGAFTTILGIVLLTR
jgi:multidrug transporter EmrE-like cation transporter